MYFCTTYLKLFACGKQIIDVTTSTQISTSGSIEAIVGVADAKTGYDSKSTVKAMLLTERNKKVKNATATYKIKEGEKASVSIPLPENIKPGQYKLRIIAKSGFKNDTKDIHISINDKNSTDIVISLDKGIYKPGDDINFRALIVSKNNYVPKEENVEISIFDGNDNRVYLNKTKSSEFGIISGKFTLANEVNSGEYKISVSTKSYKATKTFTVNPYVLPTFEVNIDNVAESYKVGDDASILVKANYFFGEPVVNASVKGTLNGEEITGLTNESGICEISRKINYTGKYELKIKVTDTSNYLIEDSKVFYATDKPFELEIYPENEDLIKGVENKIYFITKKIDGTPVKTHIEVSIGEINRQIITDESGIGYITLSSNDIDRLDKLTTITANAFNMNNENVYGEYDASIENYSGTLIGLDKLKYKENENITLSLNSPTDVVRNDVLIYKNKNLLKAISTDSDTVTFNLENVYGLIDIYVKNSQSNTYPIYKYGFISATAHGRINYSKKTIFIAPEKALNLSVETDKDEYKPGDKINLNITSKTEDGKIVESASLVSILDEAVLSLADNDLSIDNIKLALSDLKLSEELTLADLYAEVLDSTSESKLRLALIKQDYEDPDVFQAYSYADKENYIVASLASGCALFMMVFMYFAKKHSKLRSACICLIDIFVIFIILYTCFYALFYYGFDLSEAIIACITLVISIVLYALILYKVSNLIFNAVVHLVILPSALLILAFLVNQIFHNAEILTILIFLLPVVISTILIVISRKHDLNKFWTGVKQILTQCTISEALYLISILISMFIFDESEVALIVTLIILYLISQIIFRKKVKKDTNTKIVIELATPGMIVISLTIIVLILFGLYIYNTSTNSILNATTAIKDDVEWVTDEMPVYNEAISSGTSQSVFKDFDRVVEDIIQSTESENTKEETKADTDNNEKKEENLRNIFLESLTFIPEVITKNGKANISLNLSDNITTWNIQAIGNTKDGRISYSSAQFKVFKEFFIDFSLPTNSIVSDKTSIPVTIYNYQNIDANVNLKVKENDWSTIESYTENISILPNSTKMVYVPLELIKDGKQTLRIEATLDGISDIVEKSFVINPNGLKKAKVISSGSANKKVELDYFTTEEAIENTRKIKVKLYPSIISQTIESMDNIFRMPTGCFEQTSSSLYPDILALKYLEDTGLYDPEIKEKALKYISDGYQRILTFETKTPGGYSLYGNDPAETVLTAFGLMELNDLKAVYDIEDKVTEEMVDYLFSEQNINGSFNFHSTYIGSADATNDLAMNAYITWALSEVCPFDSRLDKSVKYLENHISDVTDNYTLALMANVFSNTLSNETKTTINKLIEKVVEDKEGGAYITSETNDYWGTMGRHQNIQTTALLSMVLTKERLHNATNNALLKYIIASKDEFGTWTTTQATILALKAINYANSNENLSNQKITVTVNDKSEEIEIKDNPLDLYEMYFDNVDKENKISLQFKKGNIYYEITEEYYIDFNSIDEASASKLTISQEMNQNVNVNDIIKQSINVENTSFDDISNGLIQISIPQGCSVIESSLQKLKQSGSIEKYEYNYSTINLYIRNFDKNTKLSIDIEYRANYPEQITGGMIRIYDYYNPSTEGLVKPLNITVKEGF